MECQVENTVEVESTTCEVQVTIWLLLLHVHREYNTLL